MKREIAKNKTEQETAGAAVHRTVNGQSKGAAPNDMTNFSLMRKALWIVGILLVFEVLIYCIHIPMGIVSDDAYHLEHGVLAENLFELIRGRFFSNGRFLTDGAAFFAYHLPFSAWKILDSGMYGVLLILIWRMFTDRSEEMFFICAGNLLMFPIYTLLQSAGYIATSANYIYTFTALLIGVFPVIKCIRQEHCHAVFYLLSLSGIVYTCNQDQMGVICIGAFFFICAVYLVRWIRNQRREDFRVLLQSTAYLLISLLVFGLMFLVPGHIERMKSTAEMEAYLPVYAEWSTGYKLYRGAATTFAWLFFSQPALLQLFCLSLLVAVYIWNRRMIVFPVLLLMLTTAVQGIDRECFVIIYEYAYHMPDLQEISTHPQAIIVSILIFILMILSVAALWNRCRDLCVSLFILNILGFGSRIMMGFSATIYASSFRTFTAQLLMFAICNILVAGKILERMRRYSGIQMATDRS